MAIWEGGLETTYDVVEIIGASALYRLRLEEIVGHLFDPGWQIVYRTQDLLGVLED